jgi:hypothetical protein
MLQRFTKNEMQKMKFYKLNDQGKPIHEPDKQKWEEWFETAHRQVAYHKIGRSIITTVFLGFGYDDGEHALWDTIVQGGKLDQVRDRCDGSWEQAEAMHEVMVQKVKAKENL